MMPRLSDSCPSVSLLGFLGLSLLAGSWQAPAQEPVRFNRDVRPILSDACFQCHGPDEKQRKAGLRLDVPPGQTGTPESGRPALVPGQPDASGMIRRILLSEDHEDHMPPMETGKQLTREQKDTLRRWIQEGAPYEGHWAFLAPVRPPVPRLEGADHPVDAFLLERLQREGLGFQPQADKATLLRRVTLDLTGLPPTLEELDAFESDASPHAYEKAVDRLLASPHYGEHMAQEWLDLSRYADSNGFQSDGSRDMWLWRDWLIQAFNRNLPFDQFTIQQLAGDLLPGASRDQIIATGFNRNHRLNGEGGRIVDEWFVETVIDRVETTGMTWMALTLNCARCHDHKYDPISQREFYQLFAYFNSNDETGVLDPNGKNGTNTEPTLSVPNEEQEKRLAQLQEKVKLAESEMKAAPGKVASARQAWEESLRAERPQGVIGWTVLSEARATSLGGATLTLQEDGSWLASGKNPGNDTYEILAEVPAGSLGGLRLEVFPDASLPAGSLGRGSNGNFVLTGVEATWLRAGSTEVEGESIAWARAEADFEQKGYPVSDILKNHGNRSRNGLPGWAIEGNKAENRQPRTALFLASEKLQVGEGDRLRIRLHQASRFADHNVGRFRLSVTGADPATLGLQDKPGLPADLLEIVLKPAGEKRTPAEQKRVDKWFAEQDLHPVKLARARLAAAKKALQDFESKLPSVMVMRERAEPREAFILVRGEYDRPSEKVERGLPAALPPLPEGAPVNRLGLARWLVSGEHPLTARVWVNRTWERLFGTGIVKTSENFGSQSEWPVHPELLDWLAVEFMEPSGWSGRKGEAAVAWDMKAMLKLLVTSQAYRQSSAAPPDYFARDPENRLLARGPRFRLRGEVIRDQALAISGLLARVIGGPSVRPYMPEGVWDETNRYGNLRNYKHGSGADLFRRTFYTIWKRTAAPPTMLLFDAPNREICTPKRSRTNTPLQALALLNEVTFVESARAFAERMMREGGSDPVARIATGYRLATSHRPDSEILNLLVRGFQGRLDRFRAAPDSARELIEHGETQPDASLDPVELAAYTVTANILLNLDRVLTRD